MHQKVLEFPTLDSYSQSKLKRTGDTKFVDLCSDVIRMCSLTVHLLNSRMGCYITVNHFTTLLLLSVCNLIARQNILMPTNRLCLKHITSGSSICKVMGVTLITPSKDEHLRFLEYTSDGPHRIRSPNFSSACLLESNINYFQEVQKDSTMGIPCSSPRICGGDTNKVKRSSWLGWLSWQVHLGCQTDE